MAFPESFLDELRTRLAVSTVVGAKHKLRKEGREFRAIDDSSLTVNDQKKLWWDHARDEGGDIFKWFEAREGLAFPEAVERCAGIAGMHLPKQNGYHPSPRTTAGRDPRPEPTAEPEAQPRGIGEREIVAAYDYTTPQGDLLYQVVRWQWRLPDGSFEFGKKGKPKKSFSQRRPNPKNRDNWIWDIEGIDHGLYRVVELRESAPDDVVFLPEGEAKVDLLGDWGFVATCNSGGSKKWRPDHAEYFRDRDVVVLADNDKPGRAHAEQVARSLLKVARRVRVLDFALIWAGAPEAADIVDWKRHREGNAEELLEIVAQLPEWAPPPRDSKFGLLMWADQDQPGEEYDYLIEDLIPEQEAVLIIGESRSGKSFFTQDMGLSGARGVHFFGHRVIAPFGVVYCAYEAGKGYRKRLQASRKYYGIGLDDVPFAVLTKPIDLWSQAVNTEQLIEEILWIADEKFRGVRLGAVVIDTHNAATPGASEIDSKEVSIIRERYRSIIRATRAGLWIVSHKNAAGKHRGNEQLFNNIETAIDISRVVQVVDKQALEVKDTQGRVVRRATVVKQREGADGARWEFVLPTVEVGTNKYGKPRTSCVAAPVDAADGDVEAKAEARALNLSDQQSNILTALKNALAEHGIAPPPGLEVPRSIRSVVKVQQWYDTYRKTAAEANENAIKQAMKRASDKLVNLRVIGRENPWCWITGRAVKGVIDGRSRYDAQAPGWLDAPQGEVPPPGDDEFR